MRLAPDAVVAGRFRLVQELGRGSMGSVWRAHHMGLNQPCAIKFILDDESATLPEMRTRFELEAQAAARIRSPNVVQILDYGVWEDIPYIAMELLEGEDLGNRLMRCQRLDPREVAAIVVQVAHALGKAHAAGLVHRDLKPANIFLVRDDDSEIAKILDFGVAKQTVAMESRHNTRTGALVGTPSYMSPEQARGTRAIDYRSDLWSLGVIVYRCITGRLPFESDGLGELLVQIVTSPIPVPSEVANVPAGFDAWWARAVTRDPAGRFQSASEMARALAEVAGLPLCVAPPRHAFSPSLPVAAPSPSELADTGLPSSTEAFSISSPRTHGGSPVRLRRARAWILMASVVVLGLGGLAFMTLHRSSAAVPATARSWAASATISMGAAREEATLAAPNALPAPDAGLTGAPKAPTGAPATPESRVAPRVGPAPAPNAAPPRSKRSETEAAPAPTTEPVEKKHEDLF